MTSYGTLRWHQSLAVTQGNLREPKAVSGWELQLAPHVAVRVKRIFPRAWPHRSGALMLSHTLDVARDLDWVTQRWTLDMDAATAAQLRRSVDTHQAQERALESIMRGQRNHVLREPARQPREYQAQAADFALTTRRLLLADDVGLGKTMSSILTLLHPDALPAVVVTLTHLPQQWVSELELATPWLIPHVVTCGTPYDPAKKRGMRGRTPDVLIMGYHKMAGWADYLSDGTFKTVIFDEMQELRHDSTQRYAAAGRIADATTFCMGLTASPVYNYGGEMYNVISILDRDALGTRAEFIREWCGGTEPSQPTKLAVADPAALGTYLRDRGLMLRRTRAEVGRELPEAISIPQFVESDTAVLDKVRGDAVEMAKLILARTASNTDRWKASGELDWQMRQATGIAKAPYVAEFVKLLLESERQIVLYGWHRSVYDLWADLLAAYNPAFYTGSESATQKQQSKDAFLSGRSRILIMSLRSGVGLDGLQERSKVAVFGELDWSPEVHKQCIGRLRRDGQASTEPVLAYYLVAAEGSDPVIAETLNLKRSQSEPILDPAMQVLAPVTDGRDRVRKLAQAILHQAGLTAPKGS